MKGREGQYFNEGGGKDSTLMKGREGQYFNKGEGRTVL